MMSEEYVIADQATFSVWDYVVFALVLVLSIATGLFFGLSGGKQKSTKEYLLANRSMSVFPVALSILAGVFSATTMLGTPAEVYLEGSMYYLQFMGACLTPLVGAFVFGPLFYRMKVVSVFEYLECRFKSKSVRIVGAVLYILKSVIYTGVVLLGPATALSEVTGFPVWAGIVTAGAVCALYTTLGGLRGVIWADVLQVSIMVAGMSAILIQGSIEVGGFGNAWRIAEEGGRINFWDFNPDPTVRHTFWTLVVGTFFTWFFGYSVDQITVQRFGATKNLRQAQISLLLNIPGIFLIMTLSCMAGLFMYAYYAKCDPLTLGTVTDPNQLMARFAMDILSFAPGVPGLFIASLFSGALSSISSGMNSLSAVTWVDICKPCLCTRQISDKTATTITKCIGLIYAVLGVGFAFAFINLGGTIMQMALAFNGAIGSPLVGMYCLGCFFPWANWIGALAGALVGFVFPMWINLGAYATDVDNGNHLEFSVEGCPMVNVTDNTTSYMRFTTEGPTGTVQPGYYGDEITGIGKLYSLSYLYYSIVGIMATIAVGLLVSCLTGRTHPSDVDPKYMLSYVDTFWPCFPVSCREKARCGVQYDKLQVDSEPELGNDGVIIAADFHPDCVESKGHGLDPGSQRGIVNLAMDLGEKISPDPIEEQAATAADRNTTDSNHEGFVRQRAVNAVSDWFAGTTL